MKDKENPWRTVLSRFQPLIALALMVLVLSVLEEKFLSAENWLTILRQISVNTCLSLGMTLVIVSGGIDLSVGSILAFSGAVTASPVLCGLGIPRWESLRFRSWGCM